MAEQITVFNEAKAYMIDGGWEPADDIKCAIVTNATIPAAADVAPVLADYTQVTAAGSYTAGGESLGSLGTNVTETGGVMTFNSSVDPSWAQNASNGTDAYYAYVYNATQAGGPGLLFLALSGGAAVNMQNGSLTITWNVTGLYTIT